MRFLEFAPTADPRDDFDGDAVPPHLHRLANLWWNGGDKQAEYARELAALGWTIQQVDYDYVQLKNCAGQEYVISDDEFDGDLYDDIYETIQSVRAHRGGLDLEARSDDKGISIYAYDRGGREIAAAHFDRTGQTITGFDTSVKPDVRGQGIAAVMYDWVKELGYRVKRSADLTDAGRYFWQKNRGQKQVWEELDEITKVPTVVKRKHEHLDVMPNEGQPIPRGEESEYLGDLVAEMGDGFQLWSWTSHGTVTYYVFDTETRRCQLGTTGRPYSTNRDSFVIHGVYSGPKNRYRAADLYAFLILNRGLTLVSDYKQSEGGYRVWQELQRRYGKEINIHGFDTRTDEPVNVSADPEDEPDTHVDRATVKRAGPKMKRELGSISRDLRFVASAK